jgi:flavin reductase (DIM6/NTAB) family NADH-FMN oxidoreductase RutF
MIDPDTKRSLGQMIKGVQVVAARHGGVTRAYTSHWVSQISFDEPIVLASVSPKHDTHPLMVASGRFTVSLLAADQISEGQYFSYPGRKFAADRPFVPGAIAWLFCETFERIERFDHDLFLATVTDVSEGRLGEPPLLYSARHGWRVTGDKARERGRSIRDELLARVAEGAEGEAPGAPLRPPNRFPGDGPSR